MSKGNNEAKKEELLEKQEARQLTEEDLAQVTGGTSGAVKDFNLQIADKEFIILVGPSGCGKPTTLCMCNEIEKETGKS